MKRLLLSLLFLGCEGAGELGPKPTEIVLASAKKDQAKAGAYTDPYADATQLKIEKKNLARACDELQKKLSVSDASKLPALDKDVKDAITAVAASFPGTCANSDVDLERDFKVYGAIAKDAYYLGNDLRMHATDGIDKVTGKVNTQADKYTKSFEAAADLYGAIGDHAFAQMRAYLMYAPLADRDKAADKIFLLIPRLSPDFGDQIKGKHLRDIMAAETNDPLRQKYRDEIFGRLPTGQ